MKFDGKKINKYSSHKHEFAQFLDLVVELISIERMLGINLIVRLDIIIIFSHHNNNTSSKDIENHLRIILKCIDALAKSVGER